MKITIIGYTEGFIISPSVSVYRDGIYEGEVNKNSKLIIDISAPCELEFKCSFRKTKIRIYDEQWILLSFNRITGAISATPTSKDDFTLTLQQKKSEDKKRLIGIVVAIVLIFVLRRFIIYTMYYCIVAIIKVAK